MDRIKLAFGGKAGAGKTTAVKHLMGMYGGLHLSFSDGLYQILHHAQSICGFDKEKDRGFLQYIGTEWGRGKDEDVWVNLMRKNIKKFPHDNIFIDDLRFPNEFESLRNQGFILVYIDRETDISASSSLFQTGSLHHISETSLNSSWNWDIIIKNDGGYEKFYKKLNKIVDTRDKYVRR